MGKIYFVLLLIGLLTVFLPVFAGTIEINNPLKYNTIEELIEALVNWLFTLALVLGPLIIVLAGYFFLTSGGDPQKVATAKKMVLYAAVGLIIIIMAKGIITLIKNVLQIQQP